MMRCFISIDIPEGPEEEIRGVQDALPKFEGKKTEKEKFHLTLKFLGEINEDILEEVIGRLREVRFETFEAQIDSVGFFDDRKKRGYERKIVVWLHVKGAEFLQKKIDDALGGLFEREERFMSHLTIARVKKIADEKDFFMGLERIDFPKIKFNVRSFELKESVLKESGPTYRTVEKFKSSDRIKI